MSLPMPIGNKHGVNCLEYPRPTRQKNREMALTFQRRSAKSFRSRLRTEPRVPDLTKTNLSEKLSSAEVSRKRRTIKCSRRVAKNKNRKKVNVSQATAAKSMQPLAQSRAEALLARFHDVRDFSRLLARDLEPEDCVVQSMPDVSPTKWHLAHTSWFFETFILKKFVAGYCAEIPEYAYLFNSYYNAAGDMHRRDLRGLISRPTVSQAHRYRASVDSHIENLLSNVDEKLLNEIEPILILGIHHEQQHQELLITDIKHVF